MCVFTKSISICFSLLSGHYINLSGDKQIFAYSQASAIDSEMKP